MASREVVPHRHEPRPSDSLLATMERDHLPGWLLALLDNGSAYDVGYAARHCSDRYYIRLLSERADELEAREVVPHRHKWDKRGRQRANAVRTCQVCGARQVKRSGKWAVYGG